MLLDALYTTYLVLARTAFHSSLSLLFFCESTTNITSRIKALGGSPCIDLSPTNARFCKITFTVFSVLLSSFSTHKAITLTMGKQHGTVFVLLTCVKT